MNDMTPEKVEVADQASVQVDGFTLPGLAFDKSGAITGASAIDMILQALALARNPGIDAVLAANNILIKDNNGRVVFPRPQE